MAKKEGLMNLWAIIHFGLRTKANTNHIWEFA